MRRRLSPLCPIATKFVRQRNMSRRANSGRKKASPRHPQTMAGFSRRPGWLYTKELLSIMRAVPLPGCKPINMLECYRGRPCQGRSFLMSAEPEAIRAFEHAGWQRAAAVYTDSFAHATAPFIKPLLEVAEFSPGQHVLDVACGPGHLAAAAAARGAVAHGLDFSAAMVGVARKTHPEIVVIEGDAEDLPYPDSMFHAAVSSFGMNHVPRPQATP